MIRNCRVLLQVALIIVPAYILGAADIVKKDNDRNRFEFVFHFS